MLTKTKLPVPTAKDINDEHKLAKRYAEDAVAHAIRCGELLVAMKKKLGHGDFGPWVEKHCEFTHRHARRYMEATRKTDSRVRFDSLRQLLGVEPKPQKPRDQTPASKVIAEVAAPVEPARTLAVPSPAQPIAAIDKAPFEDGVPEYVPDAAEEEAGIIRADAEMAKAFDALMASDDRLPTMQAELKRLAGLLAVTESSRNHYLNQCGEAVRLVKTRDRRIAALEKNVVDLEKSLTKVQAENESLRERLSIMEAA